MTIIMWLLDFLHLYHSQTEEWKVEGECVDKSNFEASMVPALYPYAETGTVWETTRSFLPYWWVTVRSLDNAIRAELQVPPGLHRNIKVGEIVTLTCYSRPVSRKIRVAAINGVRI